MTRAPVLRYARYLGHGGESVYSYENFCGSCRQHLRSPYEFPKEPEAIESDEVWFGRLDSPDRELSYFAFCPWCGAEFEEEWWRNQPIQNERVIDHYQNPGMHKGDQHEFAGFSPANHWLSVSGGDKVCWCNPEIEPSILGCTIRHRNADYDAYLEAARAERESWDDDWEDDE